MPIGRIDRPTSLDPNLSAEAEQIVQESSSAMMQWLNGALDNLAKKMDEQLTVATKALQDQAAALEKEYDDVNEQFTKLLADLNASKSNLTSDNVRKIVEDTQKKVADVSDWLKKREEQWKGAGQNAVKIAVSAAKKAIMA